MTAGDAKAETKARGLERVMRGKGFGVRLCRNGREGPERSLNNINIAYFYFIIYI
jgi:hypothetical protein